MSTIAKLNLTGEITANKIVSNNIVTSENAVYLDKELGDSLYSSGGVTSSISFNWNPSQEQKIQFSLGESYEVPMYGWIVINPTTIDMPESWFVSINGRPMFHSDDYGNITTQILVKGGDVITSSTTNDRYAYFMPCKSVLQDWRDENLKADYDVWKNAYTTDSSGNPTIRNQWTNDLYGWNTTYGNTYLPRIVKIKQDVAYDANGNHVLYFQSENITNGAHGITGAHYLTRPLKKFSGDLSSLIDGNGMFHYMYELESFSGDLSNLERGDGMFECDALRHFHQHLPKLEVGWAMFGGNEELESFSGNLGSLINGEFMFISCKLDVSSIKNIFETIKTLTTDEKNGSSSVASGSQSSQNGKIHIGTKYAESDSNKLAIAHACGYGNWNQFLLGWASKKWDVEWGWNGNANVDDGDTESGGTGDNSNTSLKYNTCQTYADVIAVDANYQNDIDSNGAWNYRMDALREASASGEDVGLFSGSTKLKTWYPDLPSLFYGNNMFNASSIETFEGDLEKLYDGQNMFAYSYYLSSFASNVDELTSAQSMFDECKSLSSFQSALPSLTNGEAMFRYCHALESFNTDLSKLEVGGGMFESCYSLKTFTSSLPELEFGTGMFYYCYNLSSFNVSSMPCLKDGAQMFYYCDSLSSFDGIDMEVLYAGYNMFEKCSNLRTFSSNIPKLRLGEDMFRYCKYLSSITDSTASNEITLSYLTSASEMFYCCERLDSFYGNLSSLETARDMFSYCFSLSSFDLTDYDCNSLTDATCMFSYCYQLGSANGWSEVRMYTPNLTKADYMFDYCAALPSFYGKLSSLETGVSMFQDCSNLQVFNTNNLSSLINGTNMFYNCKKLNDYTGVLSYFETGDRMFYYCESLPSWSDPMTYLITASEMFRYCTSLSSFISSLDKLENGSYMFCDCNSLTFFQGVLNSLTNGDHMFYNCKLSAQSVKYIINSLPTSPSPNGIHIGVGYTNNNTNKATIATTCGYNSWTALNSAFNQKNWDVTWGWNG